MVAEWSWDAFGVSATTGGSVTEFRKLPKLTDADQILSEPVPDGISGPARVRGRGPRRLAWAATVAILALILFFAYLAQSRTLILQADGGSFLEQAWAMGHGNPFLHGWVLSRVSFYTTELPQYLLLEAFGGFSATVMNVAVAMTYTAVVLGAALVARGRVSGKEGLVRALIAGGILLAPALGSGTINLLSNADHTGTQVGLMLVWVSLDRARPGWKPVVLVGLLLTWLGVADPITLFEGVLPLALVCVIRIFLRLKTLREQPPVYELALAGAAAASFGASEAIIAVVHRLGGWTLTPTAAGLSPFGQLATNLKVAAEGLLQLFGADFFGSATGVRTTIAAVHLAGVILAAWAMARALRRYGGEGWLVQVLPVTIVILFAAYTVRGTPAPSLGWDAHEIVGVLVCGAILAGRLLAGTLIRIRLLPVAALVLAGYAACLWYSASRPPAVNTEPQLASWLRHHGLVSGLSSPWDASTLTTFAHGKVLVRPVIPKRSLRVQQWQASKVWYDPSQESADFLVVLGDKNPTWFGPAYRQFGRPAAIYHVGIFTVLVWHENLLRRLGPTPSPMAAAVAPGNPPLLTTGQVRRA